MNLANEIALAHRLADAAGAAIRPHFRALDAVEIKADASPVTAADREAEAAMRTLLKAEVPQDGVIGEEFGEEPGRSGRQWVLDPIDGTRSFVIGRPIFGTLIALVDRAFPVLGVIDQPISGERWVGIAGQPTTLNGKAARTRPCPRLEGAQVASTSPHLFNAHDAEHYMALIEIVADGNLRQGPVYGGDCYNYALLASGHIDIVCESGLKLYDFAALVPVVEGAGGMMCDWNGEPLHAGSDGRVLAIGDPARLEDVLDALGHRGHEH
jgi:inositol-phosphate phosphatase/L-galactose 1-phosphate phosphatase/histidinol-phosphatase